MTNENPSGIADQASGEVEGTVSRETYLKVLGEKKNTQAKIAEMQKLLAERDSTLSQIEQEKLEAQGKWKELAEANKKLAEEFKDKNFKLVKNVADKTIKSQFKSISEKLGCVDPELAYMACSFEDLEVGEDFEFDQVKLESKIQDLTKAKPHLFKKDFKIPADVIPKDKVATEKPTSQMSVQELLNEYKQILSKNN